MIVSNDVPSIPSVQSWLSSHKEGEDEGNHKGWTLRQREESWREERGRERKMGKQRVHKSSNGKGVQPWWFSKLMIFWVEFHLSTFWLIITSIDSSLSSSLSFSPVSLLLPISRILETYAWTSEWVQKIDGRVNERKGKERNWKRNNEMEEERNEREKWQTKEREKERVRKVNEKIEERLLPKELGQLTPSSNRCLIPHFFLHF